LDNDSRRRLAVLADVLIPASDGMPSASAVGVAQHGVDRVLAARPDLATPLAEILHLAGDSDSVARLRTSRPELFAALGEIVAGAYYQDPDIQDRIGYHGRVSAPVETAPGVDETLLAPVLARGPIYRPDPRG
jgi:hypothetical protein